MSNEVELGLRQPVHDGVLPCLPLRIARSQESQLFLYLAQFMGWNFDHVARIIAHGLGCGDPRGGQQQACNTKQNNGLCYVWLRLKQHEGVLP